MPIVGSGVVWTTGGADIASGAQGLSRLLGTLGGGGKRRSTAKSRAERGVWGKRVRKNRSQTWPLTGPSGF